MLARRFPPPWSAEQSDDLKDEQRDHRSQNGERNQR
jgi:hypothetical protein